MKDFLKTCLKKDSETSTNYTEQLCQQNIVAGMLLRMIQLENQKAVFDAICERAELAKTKAPERINLSRNTEKLSQVPDTFREEPFLVINCCELKNGVPNKVQVVSINNPNKICYIYTTDLKKSMREKYKIGALGFITEQSSASGKNGVYILDLGDSFQQRLLNICDYVLFHDYICDSLDSDQIGYQDYCVSAYQNALFAITQLIKEPDFPDALDREKFISKFEIASKQEMEQPNPENTFLHEELSSLLEEVNSIEQKFFDSQICSLTCK